MAKIHVHYGWPFYCHLTTHKSGAFELELGRHVVVLWGAWAYGWHYRHSTGMHVLGLGRLELWWR